MKLRTPLKALAMGTMSVLFLMPALAGSGDAAMETLMQQYPAAGAGAEWQNIWMPQASAHAVEVLRSGDQLMREVVAGYTRTKLDQGGWENVLMSNSQYTAANPLLEVEVGSGATTTAGRSLDRGQQLAMR